MGQEAFVSNGKRVDLQLRLKDLVYWETTVERVNLSRVLNNLSTNKKSIAWNKGLCSDLQMVSHSGLHDLPEGIVAPSLHPAVDVKVLLWMVPWPTEPDGLFRKFLPLQGEEKETWDAG